jgi:CheY-like chemotaxis protein
MSDLRRVLVVDDAPDICLLARMALERVGGLEVMVCNSGEAALDAALAFQPDLVLLDVMMPGWDGPQTLAAFRARADLAHLRCVFFTARQDPWEMERLAAFDPLGVIGKPFDPMKLADELRALWRSREGSAQ